MEYLIGYIAGIITFVGIIILEVRLVSRASSVVQEISHIMPRKKGAIFEPPEDSQNAQKRIIEKNKSQGRDTRASELS